MVKNIKYNFTDIALPVKSNLAVSGIYLIGKNERRVYIGSSVNIYHRIGCHIRELKKGTHANTILQNSFNKSGIESFYVKVIELVESKDLLFERETVWINKIKPKYNIQLCPETKRPDRSSYWIICSPDNKWELIKNLTEFCRIHNLNSASMQGVANGKYKHYKNWFCRKPTKSERERLRVERFNKKIRSVDKNPQSNVKGIYWSVKSKMWFIYDTSTKPYTYLGSHKLLKEAIKIHFNKKIVKSKR